MMMKNIMTDSIMKNGRRLYKVTCKSCNKDRGFQRKREADKNCRSCDNITKNIGKTHSEESKIKRSAWNQGINVADFKEFSNIREQRERYHFAKIVRKIFERDNFTCDCCNKYGGKLNAHHLESFSSNPDLRLEFSNIITLCEPCHLQFHVEYTRKNNTKDQYLEYKEKRCQTLKNG